MTGEKYTHEIREESAGPVERVFRPAKVQEIVTMINRSGGIDTIGHDEMREVLRAVQQDANFDEATEAVMLCD
jgi:hypothetical protein